MMSMESQLKRLFNTLITQGANDISPLGVSILSARYMGLCKNSWTYARHMKIAHALVIRECVLLADQDGLLYIQRKNERSQSLDFSLSDKAFKLLDEVLNS